MSDTNELKIGLFGGGSVGKTCINLRYIKNDFTEGYIPTIEDEFSKVIDVDNKTICLVVIDTAGQDDFAEMRYTYYSKVHGFIFVYDLSNPASIDDLRKIYKDALDSCNNAIKYVIAANKCDLFEFDFHLLHKEMDCLILHI